MINLTYSEKLIAPYLIRDEKIAWIGTSQDRPSNGLLPFIFSLLLFLFIFVLFRATSLIIPVAFPILLSLLSMIGMELYNRLKLASNYYVITDQRILIIKAYGKNQVEIILPEAITQIKKEQVNNDTGNLYYAYETYTENGLLSYKQIGFEQVDNISQACEALEKLYKLGLVIHTEQRKKLTDKIHAQKEQTAYTWPFLYQAVEPHLLANEELLWVDKSYKVDDSNKKSGLGYSVLLILVALCFYSKAWVPITILVFIFSFIYRTASTEKHKTLQNSIYFITTKRAVILVDNKIQRGFCPQHINQLKLEKINDDIGTIYFQQEYKPGSEGPDFIDIGFVNIRDRDYVALLLEWLKTQRFGN